MDVRKVLGQSAPSATTLTDLYTVPADTQTVVSSLLVCNRDSTDGTFRLSVAVAGAADSEEQYLYFDTSVPANDSMAATLGITLGAGDVIRVYASSANFSFGAFGLEVS